jgi:hypothetical protein
MQRMEIENSLRSAPGRQESHHVYRSLLQLSTSGLPQRVRDVLARTTLTPERLELG